MFSIFLDFSCFGLFIFWGSRSKTSVFPYEIFGWEIWEFRGFSVFPFFRFVFSFVGGICIFRFFIILVALGAPKDAKGSPFWIHFGSHFREKIRKKAWTNVCENRFGKNNEKLSQKEPTVMRKGTNNKAKTQFFWKRWLCENHCFSKGKTSFLRFQGCNKSIPLRFAVTADPC